MYTELLDQHVVQYFWKLRNAVLQPKNTWGYKHLPTQLRYHHM
jgi:hypothetical protein